MSMRSLFPLTSLAGALSAISLALPVPAQAATLTLSDSNCASYTASSANGNLTITCVPVTVQPPSTVAPSGCSLSVPATANVGDTLTVTGRCTAGAPVDFLVTWSGAATGSGTMTQGTAGGSAATSVGPAVQGTYNFAASVKNAVQTTPVAINGGSVVVSAAPPPPPPPPTPGVISCASQGFAKTNVINLNWGPTTTGNVTGAISSWGANEALVVAFTTPAATSARTGNINVYEFGGSPAYKTATLSATACDFGRGLGQAEGLSVPLYYTVGPNGFGYPALQPNTTYYYNVVNRQNGAESCFGNCAAKAELSKPRGL